MTDLSLLQSGFDAEILLNRRYIRYLLMNSIETGALPMQLSFPFELNGNPVTMVIDLYAPEDYDRAYDINPAAVWPLNTSPDSFDCEILFDSDINADLRIRLVGDITGVLVPFINQAIDLYASFTLVSYTDNNGNQSNARLQLALLDMQGPIIDTMLSFGGITKEELLAMVKPYIDRDVPLSMVGSNQQVQQVALKKLPGADIDTAVIGLYLNLVLRTGPLETDVLGQRGNLDNAINFLPAGDNLAFGMAGTIYSAISTDAFQRTAVETPEDSGTFEHPILSDPSNKKSDRLGTIKDITIAPKKSLTGDPLGELLITVHGELTWDVEVLGLDIVPDPDFWLYITIKPTVNNGLIDWEISYDIDFDPVYKIVINLLVGSLLACLFIATLGAGAILVGGAAFMLLFALEDAVVEPFVAAAIAGDNEDMFDTSFLDAMPNRLTIESRRWDPFYTTDHQVAALTDGVQIRDDGMGFSGKAKLDKQPVFINHIVARQESRNASGILDGLWYRVKDHNKDTNDFVQEFPASDRRPFVKIEDDAEKNLYALNLAQIESRLDEARLLPRILYDARKVYLRNNQVHQILAISQQEIKEITNDLKDTFKENEAAAIRAAQEDALRQEAIDELTAETGNAPSDEDINTLVDEKVDALVKDALKNYTDTQLTSDLEAAVDAQLRFDLESFEMGTLQQKLIVMLSRFSRVIRQGKPYYRDRPDGFKVDNLMELPKYTPDGM